MDKTNSTLEVIALQEAARLGDVARVSFLLSEGADPNAALPRYGTALHVAAFANCPEVIAVLVAGGADVNAKLENDGIFSAFTPLHCTVEWNSVAAARSLIQSGADLEARNAWGETPLRVAVETSGTYRVVSPQIARFLIESGADGEARDREGKTVLDEVKIALDLSPEDKASREIFALLHKRNRL